MPATTTAYQARERRCHLQQRCAVLGDFRRADIRRGELLPEFPDRAGHPAPPPRTIRMSSATTPASISSTAASIPSGPTTPTPPETTPTALEQARFVHRGRAGRHDRADGHDVGSTPSVTSGGGTDGRGHGRLQRQRGEIDPSSFDASDIRVSRNGDGLALSVIGTAPRRPATRRASPTRWPHRRRGMCPTTASTASKFSAGKCADWAGNASPDAVLGSFVVGITPPPVILGSVTARSIVVASDHGGGPNIRVYDPSGQLVQSSSPV